jgi:hypothetical protein
MWVMPDGSYELRSDKPPAPVSRAGSEQEAGQIAGGESKETEVG